MTAISPYDIVLGIAGLLALIAAVAWKPLCARRRALQESQAIQVFRLQREHLEAKFFDVAVSLGKPRGLRWIECEWYSDVSFARDTRSGLLTAFVHVNIRFEAIEDGDMDGVEAVETVRDAAALFHFYRNRWGTGGKALFNMNPQDALTRLSGQFEPVIIGQKTVSTS